MLTFTNLALRRGTELLFEDVSFTIHRGQKTGLIGANGAGKTSLFKLVCGELDADKGLPVPALRGWSRKCPPRGSRP